MARVFWSFLLERSVQDNAVAAAIPVAMNCGRLGYSLLISNYGRTDMVRNKMVATFLGHSDDPNDALVMLDCDHTHPMDIVERLASHDSSKGVVGALAFRRGVPYDPCFFVRTPDGQLATPMEFKGLHEGTIVGTGAICIRRWVFDALAAAGIEPPYFRYQYQDGTENMPSEDMYFGYMCEQAGISHWCDTDLVTPHLISSQVDQTSWSQYLAEHPVENYIDLPVEREAAADK